ncbi:MAG: YfiR family protein [Bacteroidales bacterium]|jgi:hypothetical protein|nr:YfiR family protein [Bacteroidales bacterium]
MKVNTYKILFLFLLYIGSSYGQVSEYESKAAFIERFTRFVKWPSEIESQTFKMVVFGENPFNDALDELFEGTQIKNQNVELIYTDKIEDLNHVNLVYISSSEKSRVEEILIALSQKPILIIGDSNGFCKMGVHINMYVDDNYVRYEINQKALKESGIKVSSLLFASAKIVKTDE